MKRAAGLKIKVVVVLCVAVLFAYCAAYAFVSRAGMYEGIGVCDGVFVWGFNPVAQRLEQFQPGTELFVNEESRAMKFAPLIILDELVGNVHVANFMTNSNYCR